MEDMSANKIAEVIKDNNDKFVESVLQNPDLDARGGIPDLIDGPSFIRSQMITTSISVSDVVLADTYDVYIVQWDFETNTPCKGRYYGRDTSVSGPGYANLYDANPIFEIECGGLQVYVMKPNESPFPSNNPDVNGLVAPIKTFSLRFGTDIISGNSRLVGSDFEVLYTGPEVTAQGTWTQSTYSSYPALENNYFGALDPAGPFFDQILTTTKSLPPGDVSTMVKYPGSMQRPAFDGVLQTAIINYHNNFPTLGMDWSRKYRTHVPAGGSGSFYEDLFVAQHRNFVGGLALGNPRVWDSHCELHYAVGTGFLKNATLQVMRRITVETFPNPTDNLIAFAHPSPMANPQAITDVMNAVRNSQRFWSADDNAFGGFSKALKKTVKKVASVGKVMAPGFLPPQVQAGLSAVKSVKKASKTDNPEELKRQVQSLTSKLQNIQVQGESGKMNMSVAKAKRPRTKPARS